MTTTQRKQFRNTLACVDLGAAFGSLFIPINHLWIPAIICGAISIYLLATMKRGNHR